MFQYHQCSFKLKIKRQKTQTKASKQKNPKKPKNQNNKCQKWICCPRTPCSSPNPYTSIFSLWRWKERADLCELFWGITLQWDEMLSRRHGFIQLTMQIVPMKETQVFSSWVRGTQIQVWDLLDLFVCPFFFFRPFVLEK